MTLHIRPRGPTKNYFLCPFKLTGFLFVFYGSERGGKGGEKKMWCNFSIKTTTTAVATSVQMPRVNIKIVWGSLFMLIALSSHVTDMCVCWVCVMSVLEMGFVWEIEKLMPRSRFAMPMYELNAILCTDKCKQASRQIEKWKTANCKLQCEKFRVQRIKQ